MTQQSRFAGAQQILEEEIRRQQAKLEEHKPNILIVGRTGAGKSSLINAILGANVAETGAGKPITQSYHVYTHPLVTLIDSVGWEGGAEGERRFLADTEQLLKQHRTTDVNDHIHIVWYVISAADARVENFDGQLVRDAFGGIPVLFVLTKCDTARPEEIEKVEQAITDSLRTMAAQQTRNAPAPKAVGIIRTAADPLPILATAPWGLKEVVDATLQHLPDLFKAAFEAAQVVDLTAKDRRARGVIAGAVALAAGVGASPIPFSDAAILTPMQVGMVGALGVVYGFGSDPKSLAGLLTSSIMPVVMESGGTLLAANLVKFIPGAGSVIGGAINAAVAASLTAAIGLAFQQAFHHLAYMRATGKTPVTLQVMGDYLKQALTMDAFKQALEAVKARGGFKSFLPGGSESGGAQP